MFPSKRVVRSEIICPFQTCVSSLATVANPRRARVIAIYEESARLTERVCMHPCTCSTRFRDPCGAPSTCACALPLMLPCSGTENRRVGSLLLVGNMLGSALTCSQTNTRSQTNTLFLVHVIICVTSPIPSPSGVYASGK